jgi:methyl-accepting chemotaxis protein
MKKIGSSHIRKCLWSFVLAVVLTTLASYFFVCQEIFSLLTKNNGAIIDSSSDFATVGLPPTELKMRILLLMSAASLILLLVSYIWLRVAMRQIHRPILTIRRALFRLAQGRLNETVTLDRVDEFGQMGAKINELAANLQELLLCIWKQTGQCLTTLERLQFDSEQGHKCALPDQTIEQLQQVTAAIENLREMAKAYVFYDVRLDGEQTLAINEPGQKKTASTSSL